MRIVGIGEMPWLPTRQGLQPPVTGLPSDRAIIDGQGRGFIGSAQPKELVPFCIDCGCPLSECPGHYRPDVSAVSLDHEPLRAALPWLSELFDL